MKAKYLLIITLVLGIALFAGATIYSANSTQAKSSSSSAGSGNNVFVNQHQITINEACSGVSCPYPNVVTTNITA